MSGGALLVCGATSGAGKSTVAAALCRLWSRQGRRVAPFKAQNMSNHAAVTNDGGEVGRSQAMQALAARTPLRRHMNPVLLKPSRAGVHQVVMGDERLGPMLTTAELQPLVLDALTRLRHDFDWVVAEGAGGAAEINMLDDDLVNLPLAAAAGIPAVLVVDIDRGGAFAAAHGTVDLVPPHLRDCIAGIIFNQMRGEPDLLAPGLVELERRTGVPVLGVLPHLGSEPMLGVEDALDIAAGVRPAGRSRDPVRVAAIRLPHLANPADLDPFLVEPDVELRWVVSPGDLAAADLVVLPGSRATVADLHWLRAQGFPETIAQSSAAVVGICAGFQMLGRHIDDDIESGEGRVEGLGLLDTETVFSSDKMVCRSEGFAATHKVSGYQIRLGHPSVGERPWLTIDGAPEGAVDGRGRVMGTSLHGVFDEDDFRRGLLADIAATGGRRYSPGETGLAAALDRHHDVLADWLGDHVDPDVLSAVARRALAPSEAPGW